MHLIQVQAIKRQFHNLSYYFETAFCENKVDVLTVLTEEMYGHMKCVELLKIEYECL